jgi:hypothetical protein
MAQWNKNQQDYLNQERTLHEVYLQADQYGNILNEGATYRSAFGEQVSVPVTPVIQLDGLYGLLDKNFETFTGPSIVGSIDGTAGVTTSLMEVSTGDGYGYGVLRSRRSVRYRPGQGAMARFTAAFTGSVDGTTNLGVGITGYTQRAGFFTQEQALQIGFDDVNGKFGILRQNGGKAQIETLTITTGASVAGIATVELPTASGIATYSVPIVDTTADEAITAAEISEWFQTNQSASWTVEHCDGVVNFLNTRVGTTAGVSSYIPGATGSIGSITTTQVGVDDTLDWTYQEDWDDPLDGTGTSGIILDPTKLNVYQINFRWLGIGIMIFALENPLNGDMYEFHRKKFTNLVNAPHLDNPSLKIGYVAARILPDFGGFQNVRVAGGSMMGAIEGLVNPVTLPTSAARLESATFAQNALHHGLTIHNRLVFGGKINTREILIKEVSIVATPSTGQDQPCEVVLFYNFDGLPSPSVYKVINSTQSSAFYNDTTGTLTQGSNVPIYSFFITAPGNQTIDLENLRIAIPPNNEITVAVKCTGSALDGLGVGLSFVED